MPRSGATWCWMDMQDHGFTVNSSSRVRVPALGAGACLSFPYRAAPVSRIASRVFTPEDSTREDYPQNHHHHGRAWACSAGS